MQVKIEDSTYLSFIDIAIEIASQISPYSSRFSKRTFTQQQLLVLLIFKQKLKLSYRDLIEDIKTRESILLMLGLSKLPKPTTLIMFANRVKCKMLSTLLGSCINLTRKKKTNLGIDATGYHLEDGSYHYRKRLGKRAKVRKNLKLSIVAETDKQLILAAKIRKNSSHDNRDFLPLVKKASNIKPVKIISADKAYDSEENYRFVYKVLHAKPAISQRDYGNKRIPRNNRRYRNKGKREFNEKEYHQRSKLETINFVMKRLFGAVIYAKEWMMQKKELLLKCLAYNIHRLVKLRRI